MKLALLALRNLLRNPRRTVLTVLAVAFGTTMIHLMVNLQTGQYAEMIRVGVAQLAGHVVVQADGYQDELDGDLVVRDVPQVYATLAGLFPDAVIAPRLQLGGLLTSTTGSVGIGLSGVDAVAEAKVQDLDEQLVDGTWLDGDGRGIVVGRGLADTLGVEVGDKLVYMGQHGGSPEVSSRLFRVKGVFRTGAPELDGFVAFADVEAVWDVFGSKGVANRVTVHLADPSRALDAADAAAAAFADQPELDVRSWMGALPEIYGLIQLDRSSGDAMLVILGVIVAMGVLNTVLMSVLERTRELGVLLAIGMRPELLAGMVLLEGALIGVVGALLGAVSGAVASWPLVRYGIDYSAWLGGDTFETAGIAVSSVLHARYDPVRMTTYSVGAVLFTTLAAAYPAIHVARLRPVAAMRHT